MTDQAQPSHRTVPAAAGGGGTPHLGLHRFELREAITPAMRIAVTVLIAAVIVFLRRPQAVLHPQFWAEDGPTWFAGAYDGGGLREVFVPYAGYLGVLPRTVAFAVSDLRVGQAATAMAFVAFAVQVTTATFIAGRRFGAAIGSRPAAIAFAIGYLLVPNSAEIAVNLTNAQWHLALLGVCVLVARPPESRFARAAESLLMVVFGLSGPFSILLALPAIGLLVARRGDRDQLHARVLTTIVVICALVQFAIVTAGSRAGNAVGLDLATEVSVYVRQVVVGWLFGQQQVGLALTRVTGLALFAVPVAVVVVTLRQAPAAIKVIAVYGLLAYAVALPSLSGGPDLWQALRTPGVGQRYYFLPMMGLVAATSWIAFAAPRRAVRLSGALLLALALVFGVRADFRYGDRPVVDYRPYEVALERPGAVVSIPVQPGFMLTLRAR